MPILRTESKVEKKCSDSSSVALYDHGYMTSPSYPSKYYTDAFCHWTIFVQRSQTIRFILFDFELDVKRAGKCIDFLDISAAGRTYFRDCGALGKQVVDVNGHRQAAVTFRTSQTSLTQRGFLLYFEGKSAG